MSDPCKTPSPDDPRASRPPSSPARPAEPLFKTITSDDWKRSLDLARLQQNAVSEQIRTVISSSSKKTR